nr:probable polyol transporter 3 [Coffea arabica]
MAQRLRDRFCVAGFLTDQGSIRARYVAHPDSPGKAVWGYRLPSGLSYFVRSLGYDTGVMSGAMIYIQRDLKISDVQKEVLVATINVYSFLGSAIAGLTCDWVGRRYTIAMAGVIFFAGAFLMAFATNYAFLMVGRFVTGIGLGMLGDFPPEVKGSGKRLGSGHEQVDQRGNSNGLISMYKVITIGGAFFLFGGIAFVAFVFFFTLLPETRGRGLEEMEEMFGTFCKWRSTFEELEERNKLKAEEEARNDVA